MSCLPMSCVIILSLSMDWQMPLRDRCISHVIDSQNCCSVNHDCAPFPLTISAHDSVQFSVLHNPGPILAPMCIPILDCPHVHPNFGLETLPILPPTKLGMGLKNFIA